MPLELRHTGDHNQRQRSLICAWLMCQPTTYQSLDSLLAQPLLFAWYYCHPSHLAHYGTLAQSSADLHSSRNQIGRFTLQPSSSVSKSSPEMISKAHVKYHSVRAYAYNTIAPPQDLLLRDLVRLPIRATPLIAVDALMRSVNQLFTRVNSLTE